MLPFAPKRNPKGRLKKPTGCVAALARPSFARRSDSRGASKGASGLREGGCTHIALRAAPALSAS
jgi:hypothetical protein